ncbi:MAG: carboxypeptidase-like regulatory domain-containing protein [Bacteroidota bacterium]
MRIRLKVLGLVLLVLGCRAYSQDHCSIRGRVLDNVTKDPVSGVNVIIRGEKKGTFTDTAGYFRLELPDNQKRIIVFSHIAYHKENRLVSFDTARQVVLRIYLIPDTLRLEEFVITGFKRIVISEAAKRRALFTIGGDEFEKMGWDDMEKALQYMLPFEPHFTLYVNGEYQESYVLRDIDPYTVRRVMVWEMLGPAHNKTIDIFPIGMPLHTGTHVISIETRK